MHMGVAWGRVHAYQCGPGASAYMPVWPEGECIHISQIKSKSAHVTTVI